MTSTVVQQDRASLRKILIPLALAQFICSFAGSNMNVMINDIKTDLNTTIQAVQVCITLFLLVMSALMIPGGKLTDKFGRKRCFITGLTIYGLGALISAVAPGIGVLAVGYSLFLGVGTALLIPPVYILVTILFRDLKSRAWAFGVVSGMGGIGAAAGPLIGGAIATAISWRAAFVFQAIIVALIVLAARGLVDPLPADPDRPFDVVGAILSALGLVLLVGGIMAADSNLALMAILMAAGAIILAGFFAWIRSRERAGKEVLLSTSLFRNRTSNLGMVTQNVQWAMLLGSAFAVSAYLQVVRHYNSIQTGVIFTAATVGILASSLAQGTLAKRFKQRTLIVVGFVVAIAGMIALIVMARGNPSPWYFAPGLFLMGAGVGVMLTPSVNVVQSAFPENLQGEISGLSRSISNLGHRLAPRSRAPSWSPASARATSPTGTPLLPSRAWAWSALSRPSSFRAPKSRRERRPRARPPGSHSPGPRRRSVRPLRGPHDVGAAASRAGQSRPPALLAPPLLVWNQCLPAPVGRSRYLVSSPPELAPLRAIWRR